jgi:DNA-binding YbaB/EbfC family protein
VAELDLTALFKQAQALQAKLQEMQEGAANRTVEAESGGGMVRVVVDGSMRVRSVTVDPVLLSNGDKAMLEDLVVAAVNEGLRRAQEMMSGEFGKLAGGLQGVKLPSGE